MFEPKDNGPWLCTLPNVIKDGSGPPTLELGVGPVNDWDDVGLAI